VVFALLPNRPTADYIGVKGGGLSLTLYLADANGVRALGEGERIPGGSQLRFRVHLEAACTLQLASLDERGQVSDLFVHERALPLAPGETTLPGGVQLDARQGVEHFVAVCVAPDEPSFDLHAALEAFAAKMPPGVAGVLRPVPLLTRSRQSSFAVETLP